MGFFSSFYVILALFLGIVAARTPAFRPAQAQLITWGGAAGALFCMGVRIACDPVVRGELAGLGVTALAVSAAATAGSVMAVRAVRKMIAAKINKNARAKTPEKNSEAAIRQRWDRGLLSGGLHGADDT